MLNTVKMLLILLVFALMMPFGSTLSYAWDHGHQGHFGGHGYGGRGHGNFGVVFNYSPYYNPYYYPYYYDPGVLVSSQVIETPDIVEQPPTPVVTTVPNYPSTAITPAPINATDAGNEITINIPNSAGGYTSVLMKRSGNGFTGPQGEFYPEFPRVSVLKVVYGK